ncbi:MAG: glycosyltransferase family 4 protein [Burkholderiales bacterium]
MHIAMVTETYPPEVNGVARTVALMADGLRAFGHTVQLVRPRQGAEDASQRSEGYEELLCRGIPIPRYTQLKMGLPAGRALRAAWRARRPDVVHIATEGPLGWSALGAARDLELPVATDFHTNFHAYSRHYGAPWLARPAAAWLRRFHNRADCTMVPTDEMAQELERMGFERLRVVGRGVNARTFSPERRRAVLRAGWGASDDAPVALCVSRFAPEKNFPLVIEAYEAMRRANPAARLVLVGDGPLQAELQRANAGTVIAGRLVNGELSAHYASADVFLFPSLTETFGNVTLEAMASGLAVVAYRTAAARQHIVHGRSGLLAEPGDRAGFIAQAERLARDLAFARKLGRAARLAAEPVSWERIAQDFELVLADVAAPRGEPAHAAA